MILIVGFTIVAAIVVASVVFIVLRLRKYDRLLSTDNIADISARLPALKQHANSARFTGQPPARLPDALQCVTTGGTALVYTVTAGDGIYHHHLSISSGGEVLADGAGMTIAAWLAHFLDIPARKVTVPVNVGDATVRHILFTLTAAEQADFTAKAVAVLPPTEITSALWQQIISSRNDILANSRPPAN